MSSLTFGVLREANIARLPQFKNKHGVLAHDLPDGSDWNPAQWLQAMVGELGEYANERKKFERGDLTLEEFQVKAEKELADIVIYLDIMARRCLDRVKLGGVVEAHPTGVNLGMAVVRKFNEVSRRVDAATYISYSHDDDDNYCVTQQHI